MTIKEIASQGVQPPAKWAAQFISDLSLHILNEDYEALEKIKAQADELPGIRATLLVNFGEDSTHNRYGLALKNEGQTHDLLVKVLRHLTEPKAAGPLGGPAVSAAVVPLEVLRAIRMVLINSDSELSAQGHGRPASDRLELLSISDHCRQATKELDTYLR